MVVSADGRRHFQRRGGQVRTSRVSARTCCKSAVMLPELFGRQHHFRQLDLVRALQQMPRHRQSLNVQTPRHIGQTHQRHFLEDVVRGGRLGE